MRALIIYDSVYGNTEKLAKAIGNAISGDVKVLRVGEVNPAELNEVNLLVIGSPTFGGKPSQSMLDFFDKIPESMLKGVNVAVFDTRVLSIMAKMFGHAAGKIAYRVKKKGGNIIVSPEGFFLTGVKGQIKEGELERALTWAKDLVKNTQITN